MPRPTLFNNRKFMRLVSILSMPEPHILGHLEYMWRVAYEAADEHLGDSTDVELAAKWAGKPGDFTAALLQVGFLDQSSEGYIIHDFWVHAPDYVQKRAEREALRQNKGVTLSELRASAGRKGAESRWRKMANENHLPEEDSKCMANENHLPPFLSSPLPSSPLNVESKELHTLAESNQENSSPLVKFLIETWPDIKNPVELEAACKLAYPGIDLLRTARDARAWEVSKPERRKVRHGAFIRGWWAREQDRPRQSSLPTAGPSSTYVVPESRIMR